MRETLRLLDQAIERLTDERGDIKEECVVCRRMIGEAMDRRLKALLGERQQLAKLIEQVEEVPEGVS